MTKEELYKLSLDSYHEYPLLAELMAIRDERFKDEQQDSMLCVNGYVGLDTLNNYVKLQQENQQLKIQVSSREEVCNRLESNWNKLKKYIKTEIPEDVFIDTEWFVSILDKMQELEQGKDE